MYWTFLFTRSYRPTITPDVRTCVATLNAILNLVSQERSLVVCLPAELLAGLDKEYRERLSRFALPWVPSLAMRSGCTRSGDEITAANEKLFSVIRVGTKVLERLCAIPTKIQDVSLVASSMHNLPALLRDPDRSQLSRDDCMWFFYYFSAHWTELSVDLQSELSGMVGLTRADAERLIDDRPLGK
jgi:hypothetical protein